MKKRTLLIFVWIGLVVLLLVGLSAAIGVHQQRPCTGIKISINHNDDDDFVTEQNLMAWLSVMNNARVGEPLQNINLHELEQQIARNPYVHKAAVYAGLDGVIHIEVVQRKPVVRVQNNFKVQWYISDDGYMMPVNPGKPANVLWAGGNIPEYYIPDMCLNLPEVKTAADSLLVKSPLYQIWQVARTVDKDPFLRAQIEQIYRNTRGDIELVPMVGKHLIIFGDAENVTEKFNKLKYFYKNSLSREGWDKYDTLNLKFENQVVCTIK